MSNVNISYRDILEKTLEFGEKKKGRNGNYYSRFGEIIKADLLSGFPVLTSKKIIWNSVVTELIWFLKGRTDLKYLLENNCHIWTGDAYKNYTTKINHKALSKKEFEKKIIEDEQFSKDFGDLGKIYGHQWRNFGSGTDQIVNLVEGLISDPYSRRHLVSAWNVEDLKHSVLPPCHYAFQINVRKITLEEKVKYLALSSVEDVDLNLGVELLWNQRSADLFLGLPFNIASYALLLHIIADYLKFVPLNVIGSIGDAHIYENHIEAVQKLIMRNEFPEQPKLRMTKEFYQIIANDEISFNQVIEKLEPNMFKLEKYNPLSFIYAPLNN